MFLDNIIWGITDSEGLHRISEVKGKLLGIRHPPNSDYSYASIKDVDELTYQIILKRGDGVKLQVGSIVIAEFDVAWTVQRNRGDSYKIVVDPSYSVREAA